MKVCEDCDKQFPDDTRFCAECGRQLQSTATDRPSRSRGSGSHRRDRGSERTGPSANRAGTGARSGPSPSARAPGSSQSGSARSAQSSAEVEGLTEQTDLIGRDFFGEYTIVDRLGEGGMGAVYLAEQNSIDQKIALKVLHAETAESDEIVQRFHREAKVISMLTHPHIVRVFIFGRTDDDLLFLAMEYVEGVELREQLDGTPIDEMRAIKIMKQVCSALAAAHDQQILHRDLKPENILLTEFRGEEDYVKILDFGIAKIKRPESQQGPQLTQAGIVYGTPEYLSPEQAQAEDLDHRTDIYALGAILFEMLTGRVPFDAEASVEILKKKVFEDPPRPTEYAPVAPTMEQIISRAMARDREDRFDDALEMFDALVARENELQRERQVDEGDTYVPGSELTGVHRAVSPSENPIDAVQEQAAAAQRAVADTGEGDDLPNPESPHAGPPPTTEQPEVSAPNGPSPEPADPGDGALPEELRETSPQNRAPVEANSPSPPRQEAARERTGPAADTDRNDELRAARTQPQPRTGGGAVRYVLIGAVVVLAVAVLGLAGYLTYMLAS